MSYHDVTGAEYSELLRILETTDPAHADTFNPLFKQLIWNDVTLHGKADEVGFDDETNEILLKANGEVISRIEIPIGDLPEDIGIVSAEEITALVETLMQEDYPEPVPGDIASDEEIDELIDGLDDL